ncbi:MAG TPA: DUF4231 domain-containing protein [Alphaproteobacteria bacterium]|nr:DUF4231 domain-containing protein [Alphaproteobacteria bacterium]
MNPPAPQTSPPRPRLVVRLGITGHRPHQLGDGSEATHANGLRRLLKEVVSLAAAVHHDNRDIFDHASPRLRLVSALAEGADRIAASAALASGYELVCPLPFARDEYANDFKNDESRREFASYLSYARAVLELDGRRDAEDHAYEAASLVTLAQSDIVVALWDGQPSKGRGGTADTIRHAVELGLPVIWFDEYGQGPRLLFGGGTSRVSDPGDLARTAEELTPERLSALLTETFAPPARNRGGAEAEARHRLKQFLSERERRLNLWLWYPLLMRVLGGRRLRATDIRPAEYQASVEAEWTDYWNVVAPLDDPPTGVKSVVAPRYAWADKLSVYFAQAYRGSYISNFTMSALTVCLSLLSVFSILMGGKPVFVVSELILVAAILINSSLGARRNWHERWLDSRQLAEQLRHMRMLIYTGIPLFDPSKAYLRGTAEPGPMWIDWYTRATARELVPPTRRVDEDYLRTAADVIGTIEVEPQRDWHRNNAKVMERVAHRLHAAGTSLFFATGCVTLGELIIIVVERLHLWDAVHYIDVPYAQSATFFGAVLPALGAAISGIRVQADFEDVSERSHGMARHLDGIAKALRERADLDFSFVSNLGQTAAETMLTDIADWRFVFRGKSLTLPS